MFQQLLSPVQSQAYILTRRLYAIGILFEICHLIYLFPLWTEESMAPTLALYWVPLALFLWSAALLWSLNRSAAPSAMAFNYAMCILIFGAFEAFEYHVDFVNIAMGLFFMLIELARHRSENLDWVPKWVYPCGLTLGIGLFYYDSVLFKLISPMWQEGLGFAMPASIPNVIWFPQLIEHIPHGLSVAASHLTLVFELLFIPLAWFDKSRRWLIVGVLLHIGIFLAFPIPFFGYTMTVLYCLALPMRGMNQTASSTTETAASKPPSEAAPSSPEHEAWRTSRLILFGVMFWSIGVFTVMPHDVYQPDYWRRAPIPKPIYDTMGRLTGSRLHGLFIDEHFTRCPWVIATEIHGDPDVRFLPGADEQGVGSLMTSGRDWRHFHFSTTCSILGPSEFKRRLHDRLRQRFGSSPRSGELHYKTYDISYDFGDGALTANMKKPYAPLGTFKYDGHGLHLELQQAALAELASAQTSAGETLLKALE